jgi:hypothetical protein
MTLNNTLSAMKSHGALLLPLLFMVNGCLAAPVIPSIRQINEIRTILVTPLESPPLEVIPDLIESRLPVYRQYQFENVPTGLLMDRKIYAHPGGVLIAGLVSRDESLSANDFHLTPASTKESGRLEPATLGENHWSPTLVLARETILLLNREGIKARLSQHYYSLPLANEERNANLGHWRNAIRHWYSQNSSSIDYQQAGLEQVDAVLEVGIDKYRIFDAQTSMQVLMKLIDPTTGQVIGRVSAKDFSVEDSAQTLLNPEAEKFKQLVQKMGLRLIRQGLNNLGLSRPDLPAARSAPARLNS